MDNQFSDWKYSLHLLCLPQTAFGNVVRKLGAGVRVGVGGMLDVASAMI